MDIYLLIEGQQQGPYTEDQVHQSLGDGLIPDDLPAWHEGLSEWVPISRIMRSNPSPPPLPPPLVLPPLPTLSGHALAALILAILGLLFSFFIGLWAFIPAAIEAYLAKRAIKKYGYRGSSLLKISLGLVMVWFVFVIGSSVLIALGKPATSNTARTDADNDDWSADSPESMLRYATARLKKEGVGLGTVIDASYKIGDSDGSGQVFVGEITFTVHADADSTGLPSGFSGSTTQEFHAFFSYEAAKHQWSPIRITDSNNSPLDSGDPVLSTIADYFPEPYQIALHSH